MKVMNIYAEKNRKEILHSKIILFFREELDKRYHMEHLQEIPSIAQEGLLEGVTQEMIDRVKGFFREVLYPEGEERYKRDKSIEKVMALLNNKARLMVLLPSLPGILFRHGGALVSATQAGSSVLSAYRFSSKIEARAVENLEEICEEKEVQIEESVPIPSSMFRRAFSGVPRDWSEKMMSHLIELTKLGMHHGTVDATKEVLTQLRESLSSEEERQAIDHALWVLQRLEEEVRHHNRVTMKRLLRIIELSETQYLEDLYSTAGQ